MASLTVAHVRGIPVRLHVSFLLVLPIFAWLMARAYFMPDAPADAWPTLGAWVWGSLLAVGLFASVLLHEFAHSFTALKEGIPVRSITLLPIGGVSAFDELPSEPGKEFKITIVGPLTNFVIGLPLLALLWTGLVPPVPPGLPAFVAALATVNIAIGAFNLLLPAFPMDGGRILRSLLARKMGRVRATRYAALVGRGLAVLMGIFGFLTFGTGGWLLLLIAFFIYSGAKEEERATRLTETLSRFHVRDIMSAPVETLRDDATVEQAFEQMLRTKHTALPVVSQGEPTRALGIVDLAALQAVPERDRWSARVRDAVTPQETTLRPEDDAMAATKLLSRASGAALVVDEAGQLVGIVTPTDVMRIAQIAEAEGSSRGGRRTAPRPG